MRTRSPLDLPARAFLGAVFLGAALLVAPLPVQAAGGFPGRPDPSPVLDRPAPPLEVAGWLGSSAHAPEDLKGQVLLVRWWTDTCPFCSTSAPSLRELHRAYGERGLTVVGVFHPKPPGGASIDEVRTRAKLAAERFDFEFAIALDPDWSALRRWWLDQVPDAWTSVTFLVDREGIVRYVHPGGEFHRGEGGSHWKDHESCQREYREIVATIEALLGETEQLAREVPPLEPDGAEPDR